MLTPGTPGTRHGRSLRLALVLTALFVLLGLVAFASRSGLGQSSRPQPTPSYISWAVSVFFVLWVLTIPFAAYAYWIQMREFRAQNTKSFQARLVRSLGIVFLAVIAGGVIMYFRSHTGLFGSGLHIPGLPTADETGGKNGTHRVDPTFQWPVLWVTIALIAAAAVWWWRDRQNRAGGAAAGLGGPTMEDDMFATIGDAIDDLEAEPDARRAVIAAYARMEGVFARHGMRRMPSETPVEYLGRLLLGLTSRADAVTRLTGLFEHAKFSRHEIDGTMKQDAIDALRAIRDDLQPA
jgi:uncharacterized protein DUF4129